MNAQRTAKLRDLIRDHLRSIESQAEQASRISATSDNLCDMLDDIDNELQEVISLVKRARGGEA